VLRFSIAPLLTAVLACTHDEAPVIHPPAYQAATVQEGRAIAVAERFVLANGYTAAIGDPKHIQPELIEEGLPPSLVAGTMTL
jgi:hypothetical protein